MKKSPHNIQGLNPSERIFGEFLKSHKQSHPNKPLAERTIDELRNGTNSFLQYAGNPAEVSHIDKKIPMRDGYSAPIRIYNDQLPNNTPVLIFYPGCAFIFDLFEVNGIICSRIALHANIKVILVQFRLAPESQIITSLNDSYDAAEYIASHPENFGIDFDRIFLGGWCSGAHCAATVSSLARHAQKWKVYHQILLAGTFDLTASNHDFDNNEREDKILDRKFIAHIASKYYGITPDEYLNPSISPYHETHFAGLPPTTILVGEYDALRNDSEGYFRKLFNAGIHVEKIILAGQTHNTIAMRKVLFDGADPAEIFASVVKQKI